MYRTIGTPLGLLALGLSFSVSAGAACTGKIKSPINFRVEVSQTAGHPPERENADTYSTAPDDRSPRDQSAVVANGSTADVKVTSQFQTVQSNQNIYGTGSGIKYEKVTKSSFKVTPYLVGKNRVCIEFSKVTGGLGNMGNQTIHEHATKTTRYLTLGKWSLIAGSGLKSQSRNENLYTTEPRQFSTNSNTYVKVTIDNS